MWFWILYFIVGTLSTSLLLVGATTWWLNVGPGSISQRAGEPITDAEKFKLFARLCCPDCGGTLRQRNSGREVHSVEAMLEVANFYCSECLAAFSYKQPECGHSGACPTPCVGRFVRGNDRSDDPTLVTRGNHAHPRVDRTDCAAVS